MSAASVLPLIAGQVQQGAEGAANAVASVVIDATPAQRHILLGFEASYSAAPTPTTQTLTFKNGSTTVLVLRHDFAGNAEFGRALPVGLQGNYNESVTVELSAGGTGITGRIAAFYVDD